MRRTLSSPWTRAMAVLGALALAAPACSDDSHSSTTEPSTTTGGPTSSVPGTTAATEFRSTGTERDGWYWLEDGDANARWEFAQLAAPGGGLSFQVVALADAGSVSNGTGTLSMSYGAGSDEIGTRSVTLAASAVRDHPEWSLLSGTLDVPASELPPALGSMWVEATDAAASTALRAESVQLAVPIPPLGEPAVTTPPDTDPTAERIDGRFLSNGDLIAGWYWLRDAALTHYARWEFASIPNLADGITLQFHVLATDRPNGPGWIRARFFLTYGFNAADGTPLGAGETDPFPPPTGPPPDVGGTVTTLVILDNISPRTDPVGYTNQGTLDVPAGQVPTGAVSMWFEVRREHPDGTEPPVTTHVAFNAQSLGVLVLQDGGTTDDGGGTVEPGGGILVDPDGPAANDSKTDADTNGDVLPGTYEGSLGSNGDVEDWYGFHLEVTQLADIMAVPTSGDLQISVSLLTPYLFARGPDAYDVPSEGFTRAAGPGEAGRWYLVVSRLAGSGTYRFTIGVRDANDAMQGVDAGDDDAHALTIGQGDHPGEVYESDPIDQYLIAVPSGVAMTATLESYTGRSLLLDLRAPDGSEIDTFSTGAATEDNPIPSTTIVLPAATGARTIHVDVSRDFGSGGFYVLHLTTNAYGQCAGATVPADGFRTSGSPASRLIDASQGWHWLRTDATDARSQSATWIFDQLPDGDVRVVFDLPVEPAFVAHSGSEVAVTAAVWATYGRIPSTSGAAAGPPVLVTLQVQSQTGILTGFHGLGELTIPHSALASAGDGWWLRIGQVDPTSTGTATFARGAGTVGVNAASAALCPAGAALTDLGDASGTVAPPDVTVTYDGSTKTLESTDSMFVDPATDIDGDGLNQTWENQAIDLANPVIEVDEGEMWLGFRADVPTVNFVEATIWPSIANPQYVILGYLSTWGVDPGGGEGIVDIEAHRGDSERVFEAWRVIDEQHVQLALVNTSAHASVTEHSGVWSTTESRCNVGAVAFWTVIGGAQAYGTDTMCSGLTFDEQGRLVMYTSRNKHAMYPTASVCNNAVIVVTQAGWPTLFSESCGWDVSTWIPGHWEESDFEGDGRYRGQGRWQFDVYNVGEPGYPLIDNLSEPTSWVGLTASQVQSLTDAYPTEMVWGGHDGSGSNFCGGFDPGDEVAVPQSFPLPDLTYEMPGGQCSTRLGSKYSEWQDRFVEAMTQSLT